MTALVTDNLALLAGAPDGIKRLRGLILELAVRGKLVPQERSDGCAESLLRKVRSAALEQVERGKLKRDAVGAAVTEDEAPYGLPSGWVWARVADTGRYINGLAFKPEDWGALGRPIIRIQNLSGRNAVFNRTTRDVADDYIVRPGDILVSWSATLDAYYWQNEEEGVLNQHIFRVLPSDLVERQFLYWVLKASIREMEASDHAHGLVMTHINRGPFLAHVVGVPPLAEQHRIVAKVDELMALCDQLEARQADAESAHAQLVQALLDSLTQAVDAADFTASWQRLAEHFHTLFNTGSSIAALEQALLKLAVMGRLVPQDSSEESAGDLLKRISERRTRILAEEKVKRRSPSTEWIESSVIAKIPAGWGATRLEELIDPTRTITYGVLKPGPEDPRGIPLVKTENIYFNEVLTSFKSRISPELDEEFSRTRLRGGEVLLTLVGSIGRCAVAPNELTGANLSRSVGMIVPVDGIDRNFVVCAITALIDEDFIAAHCAGTAQKVLNVGTINGLVFPVPPLAEQRRIVTKVGQLMGLCSKLKDLLRQDRQVHERLADALVEQAVA